jgi:outer membrane protein TolC
VTHSRLSLQAAEAGAELAERMAHVGNWSRARQMQEELLLWEARGQLQNAELKALQTHLALWQFVGQSDAVELPALPDLPDLPDASLPSVDALTKQALAANLKWASLKTDAERLLKGQTATSLAQARQAMQPDPAKAPGNSMAPYPFTPLAPALLPANVPWSHSTENALQAQAHADALQRQIRADVRLAHAAYLHAHTQAIKNWPQVLRLHTALEQESLLRYNGMLKSTWDLLASARQRIQSSQVLHQAQTQAWLSWADLQAVLNGMPYTGQLNLDAGKATSQPSAGH